MAEIKNLADLRQAMAEKQRRAEQAMKEKQLQEQEDDFPEMRCPRTPSHSGLPDVTGLFLPEELEIMDKTLLPPLRKRELSPEEEEKLQQYITEDKLRRNRLDPIIQVKYLLRGVVNIKFDSVADVINILREIIAEHEKEIETEVPPEL